MQFETKIINGKPSIFFKQESTVKVFNPLRKLNTKDKQAKKDLLRSIDISGEIDMVRPSPHSLDAMSIQKNTNNNRIKQNGFQTNNNNKSESNSAPKQQQISLKPNDYNHNNINNNNNNNNNNNDDEIQTYIPNKRPIQENLNLIMDDHHNNNNNRFVNTNSKDDSSKF